MLEIVMVKYWLPCMNKDREYIDDLLMQQNARMALYMEGCGDHVYKIGFQRVLFEGDAQKIIKAVQNIY